MGKRPPKGCVSCLGCLLRSPLFKLSEKRTECKNLFSVIREEGKKGNLLKNCSSREKKYIYKITSPWLPRGSAPAHPIGLFCGRRLKKCVTLTASETSVKICFACECSAPAQKHSWFVLQEKVEEMQKQMIALEPLIKLAPALEGLTVDAIKAMVTAHQQAQGGSALPAHAAAGEKKSQSRRVLKLPSSFSNQRQNFRVCMTITQATKAGEENWFAEGLERPTLLSQGGEEAGARQEESQARDPAGPNRTYIWAYGPPGSCQPRVTYTEVLFEVKQNVYYTHARL